MAFQRFDLVLKGGRVIDPAAGRDGLFDVAISDGRIAAVAPAIPAEAAGRSLDMTGKLVLPGMIDTHAHVFTHVTGKFGLDADMCGVRSGVTTLVDQGGPSLVTLGAFRNYVMPAAKSKLLCYLSTYIVGGLEGHYYPELYGPSGVDVPATIKAARANADIVRGIKAHAEIGGASRWGLEVVKLAKEIGRGAGIPVYFHLGQLWPTADGRGVNADALIEELIPLLEPGDILAHPFTRHPGGFISEATGEVHRVVWEALDRGVTVDVGHGSHFSFAMARKTLAAGIMPYTLGADMHGYNVRAPGQVDAATEANPFFGVAPFSLTHAMTELLTLGVPLVEVVKTVTSHPAAMLKLEDELGTLAPGRVADVSVLELLPGSWKLSDNSGEVVTAREMLVPVLALRAGAVQAVDSPLMPKPIAAAA
jgi:dihydroorotase